MPELRQARVGDHSTIVECVRRWWGDSRTPAQARELSLLLPKLFLRFFSSTSLVLEDEAGIRAFLVGFHAADNEDEAYIHFVGVDPGIRGQGTARLLYTTFFQRAAEAGRTQVRAITSPANTGSIAFHRASLSRPVRVSRQLACPDQDTFRCSVRPARPRAAAFGHADA